MVQALFAPRWSALAPMGPVTQSFWRIKEHGGTYFSAAYDDSDATVTLFTSKDGETWAPGPLVYAKAEDTPGETELVFMPSEGFDDLPWPMPSGMMM